MSYHVKWRDLTYACMHACRYVCMCECNVMSCDVMHVRMYVCVQCMSVCMLHARRHVMYVWNVM